MFVLFHYEQQTHGSDEQLTGSRDGALVGPLVFLVSRKHHSFLFYSASLLWHLQENIHFEQSEQ